MITDRRKLTAKINLHGMSSFHFHCWNQFKVIPWSVHSVPRNVRTSGSNSFAVDADMRYICNHQVAPGTIYIQQMRASTPILFTIKNSNCAKITLITGNL